VKGLNSAPRAPFLGRTLSASAAVWVAATGTLAALAGACHEVAVKYGGPATPPPVGDGGTRPVVTVPLGSASEAEAEPDGGQDAGQPAAAPDGSTLADVAAPPASSDVVRPWVVPNGVPDAGRRPPKVKMGATTVIYGGRLPPEVIRRIVRQQQPTFRECYQQALAQAPGLAGRVVVKFIIHRDGRVGNVQPSSEPPTLNQRMVECVASVFRAMTFPQPEGGLVTVSYPLVFKP